MHLGHGCIQDASVASCDILWVPICEHVTLAILEHYLWTYLRNRQEQSHFSIKKCV